MISMINIGRTRGRVGAVTLAALTALVVAIAGVAFGQGGGVVAYTVTFRAEGVDGVGNPMGIVSVRNGGQLVGSGTSVIRGSIITIEAAGNSYKSGGNLFAYHRIETFKVNGAEIVYEDFETRGAKIAGTYRLQVLDNVNIEVKFRAAKGDGSIVGAPTLAAKTLNSITVNPVDSPTETGQSVEYGIGMMGSANGFIWQDGTEFTGLNLETSDRAVYDIYARTKENNNYETGWIRNTMPLRVMVCGSSASNCVSNDLTVAAETDNAGPVVAGDKGPELYVSEVKLGNTVLGQDLPYEYQWYMRNDNSNDSWQVSKESDPAYGKSAAFTVPTNITGTFYYYCMVTTSTGGLRERGGSNQIRVEITPNGNPDAYSIEFSINPDKNIYEKQIGQISALIGQQKIISGAKVSGEEFVMFNASVNENYRILGWEVNNQTVTTDYEISSDSMLSEYSHQLTGNAVVKVKVERISDVHEITFSIVNGNGMLSADWCSDGYCDTESDHNTLTIYDGGHINFNATPSDGYRVKEWKVNSSVVHGSGENLYYHTVTANAAVTVEFREEKSAGAGVDAPTLAGMTLNSIRINNVTEPVNGQSVEYGISWWDHGSGMEFYNWQDGLVFSNLVSGTEYAIHARAKENDTYEAGEKASFQVRICGSGDECYGENLSVVVSANPAPVMVGDPGPELSVSKVMLWNEEVKENLSYQWSGGSMEDRPTYTVPTHVAGTYYYYCNVFYEGELIERGSSQKIEVVINPNPDVPAHTVTFYAKGIGVGGGPMGTLSASVNQQGIVNGAAVNEGDVVAFIAQDNSAGGRFGMYRISAFKVDGEPVPYLERANVNNKQVRYLHTVTKDVEVTVEFREEKAESDAVVAAPTLAAKTLTSITINPVAEPGNGQKVEYAIGNSLAFMMWQDGLVFSDLPSGGYEVYARAKENENYEAGKSSSPLYVRICETNTSLCTGNNLTVSVSENPASVTAGNSESVVLSVTEVKLGNTVLNTGLSYSWLTIAADGRGSGREVGNSATYTVPANIAGKFYYRCVVRYDGELREEGTSRTIEVVINQNPNAAPYTVTFNTDPAVVTFNGNVHEIGWFLTSVDQQFINSGMAVNDGDVVQFIVMAQPISSCDDNGNCQEIRYIVSSWEVNEQPVIVDEAYLGGYFSTYSHTVTTDNVNVKVKLVPAQKRVITFNTVDANGSGRLEGYGYDDDSENGGQVTKESPDKFTTYDGENISLNAYPADGYRVKEWKAGGIIVPDNKNNRYEHRVTTNANITVEFEPDNTPPPSWDCGVIPGTVTATLIDGTLTISGSGAMKNYSPGSLGKAALRKTMGDDDVVPWLDESGNIITVVIGEGVISIGANAFAGCNALTAIISLGTNPPTMGVDAFGGVQTSACLHVPSGSETAYTDAGWAFSCVEPLFTVTFSLNYSWAATPTTVMTSTDKKLASLLASPSRTGYTFDGWFTSASGGTAVTTNTVFDANAIIYAKWTPIEPVPSTYTITFDANGGSVSPTFGTTGTDGKLTSLPSPNSRSNYTFNGWYTAASGGTQVTTSYVFSASITIYAHWTYNPPSNPSTPSTPSTPTVYTITFNANGGSVSPSSGTTSTGFLSSLPTPSRAGHTFSGWYTALSGGSRVTTNYPFGGNSTIYAHWTVNSYAITFSVVSNGALSATVDGSAIASGALVPYGKTVVFTAIPVGGYSVSGWTRNGEAVAGNTAATYTLQGVSASTAVAVSFSKSNIIASPDRVIPSAPDAETVAVAPVSVPSGEFTAGPNPADRSLGGIAFFWQGKRIAGGSLVIYDATGNVVNRAALTDDAAIGKTGKRAVGSWDLRDGNGRLVSEGTYLVRGAIKTSDGKDERVSVVVGVR